MQNNFIETIRKHLLLNGSYEHKNILEKYFKNVTKFYGLRATQMREIFKNLYKEIKLFSVEDQIDIAFDLFASEYFEDKTFAILILHKLVKNNLDANFLDKLQNQIEKNIYDWGNCDVLSSKVNTNIILKDANAVAKIVKRKNSKFLWLQRSACVSFVRIAKTGNYNNEVISICSETIKNPERFVQLGTGWVLRELSLANLHLTEDFIKDNYSYFSREGLRYAVEKMTPEKKKEILQYKK